MLSNSTPIIIVGCGDIGTRLAQRWLALAHPVYALTRSGDRAEQLQSQGISVLRGDLDVPQTLTALAERIVPGSVVYYLAPPSPGQAGDPRVEKLLAVIAGQTPGQVIYMGTSGVYGDTGGNWVDEESPLRPQTARARRRLAAEQALRRASELGGWPLTLLRVGGIYGPDRLPLARLKKGLPVLREAECGYTNRIHVEDLLRICIACAEHVGEGARVFNVSDNAPGNMTQYFLAVAEALGLPQPPQLPMTEAREQLSAAMLSYLTESRRMDSRRVLRELGLVLHYPDLAAGLAGLGSRE